MCIFAADYEKSRNEKSRNMENPFKFGTIVEAEYFTDRIEEVAYICDILRPIRDRRSILQGVDYEKYVN